MGTLIYGLGIRNKLQNGCQAVLVQKHCSAAPAWPSLDRAGGGSGPISGTGLINKPPPTESGALVLLENF